MAIQNQGLSLLEQTNHQAPSSGPKSFSQQRRLLEPKSGQLDLIPRTKGRMAWPLQVAVRLCQNPVLTRPSQGAAMDSSVEGTTEPPVPQSCAGGGQGSHLPTPPAAQVQVLETVARPRSLTLRGEGWGGGARPAVPKQKGRNRQSCCC